MKLLAIVVLFSVAAAVKAGLSKDEKIAMLRSVADGCASTTGATKGDIENVLKHRPAQNMESKCLRACILKKLNVMNDDGKFVKDIALKLSDMHSGGDAEKMKIAEAVVNVCYAIEVPDDHCEAAEHYKMCILEEAKKHGIQFEE